MKPSLVLWDWNGTLMDDLDFTPVSYTHLTLPTT